MSIQYARHNVNADGRCKWRGKLFRPSEAVIGIRHNTPLVEPIHFARTEMVETALACMLNEQQQGSLIN